MIKKVNEKPEQNDEEQIQAIEQAMEITQVKLNKALVKKSNLEMDIESLVLTLKLMQEELNKYGN